MQPKFDPDYPDGWEYENEPVKFWKHSYMVCLNEFDVEEMYINADNEQDALDYAIDIAEEKGWMGLFIENPTKEERDEHVSGGNHGLLLGGYPIIKKVKDLG
jgi:hypothetical protein